MMSCAELPVHNGAGFLQSGFTEFSLQGCLTKGFSDK